MQVWFEVDLRKINHKRLSGKIRVAAVSYLNTKPLIYGFEKGMLRNELELITDYPARIADMLFNNEIDIGLVPVATIPRLRASYIITDYCIGATGAVASVCLFSDVPVEEIKIILTDYQSRSSAALLKILLKEYWKTTPVIMSSNPGYEENISGNTAGLVIGDRALIQRHNHEYIYDLAEAWINMTKLPFIFAAWISNKKLTNDFIGRFNAATGDGFRHLDEMIKDNPFPAYDLKKYYTENISYDLTKEKLQGMNLYLSKVSNDL